jgi:hypothetical protein
MALGLLSTIVVYPVVPSVLLVLKQGGDQGEGDALEWGVAPLALLLLPLDVQLGAQLVEDVEGRFDVVVRRSHDEDVVDAPKLPAAMRRNSLATSQNRPGHWEMPNGATRNLPTRPVTGWRKPV